MIGQSISHYEVTGKLGEGGMGVVYRARDTKLGRDVALKVLPEQFAREPQRMGRFAREAHVLASLNHPHIAAVYGLEEQNGIHALVMELVEGPTLADRIAEGPMPLDEALPLAQQVADALEHAHESGIIHRDLKPANVKLAANGAVKVLDFGLAKAMEDEVSAGDPVNSPTLSIGATRAGVILGTAAYMSPEQARGKKVDKRADIWAFGVLLYEMVTGKRLFRGEDLTDTLASVVRDQPDLSAAPPRVQRLLEKCLEKDPNKRLRDISGVVLLLEPPASPTRVETSRRSLAGWVTAALLAVALGITTWALWPAPAELKPLVRLDIELDPPVSPVEGAGPILSPDGSRLVYVARRRLYTRRLDQAEAIEIEGTDGAESPFFSPDGEWVGFYAEGGLKKASIEGGGVFTIPSDGPRLIRGGDWGEDGNIITMSGIGTTPLVRISAAGGRAEPVTELDHAQGELAQAWPQLLPGGKTLLFTSFSRTAYASYIVALSLADGDRKAVQRGATAGRYVEAPGGTGYLLYGNNRGTLFAVPFDPERREIRGIPLPIVEGVRTLGVQDDTQYNTSRNGTLVYQRGSTGGSMTLQWVDGTGKVEPLLAKTGDYLRPRLSPDGSRVAMDHAGDIWTYDRQRDIMTRLTFDGGSGALWSPDGRFVLYSASAGLSWTRSDGGAAPQVLIRGQNLLYPWSFTPDGKRLAYLDIGSAGYDLYTVAIENDGGTLKASAPEELLKTPADERYPSFSPDGRWMVYTSDESGTFQVYVRDFPGLGRKVQVSSAGGAYPVWSSDGRTLFFHTLDNQVMTVNYTVNGNVFAAGKPRLWSETRLAEVGTALNYDVDPDGKRILALLPAGDAGEVGSALHVTILFNLFDELQRRAAAGN